MICNKPFPLEKDYCVRMETLKLKKKTNLSTRSEDEKYFNEWHPMNNFMLNKHTGC